jgi:hypothetical protein
MSTNNGTSKEYEVIKMSTYPVKDVSTNTDRHKLYTLMCNSEELFDKFDFIKSQNIKSINIGKELSNYIQNLEDFRYLNIEVYDYIKKLIDKEKSKINGIGNYVVAIFNLGILMEPIFELNVVQLLKEFSKSTSIIIIWDNHSDSHDRLEWPTQKQNFGLDFSDIQLKKLQYAI